MVTSFDSFCYMSLTHYLHDTIDHLEERGMKRGDAQQSSLIGQERDIVNQANIGTVSVPISTLLT